jgi:predicted secreted protein
LIIKPLYDILILVRGKDSRSRNLIFLAHCLLNQNAKVQGLAGYRGAFEPLIRKILRSGVGLIQLPCPEMACLGPKRPLGTDTVEQYDTPRYRSVCRRLARAAVREIRSYQKNGYKVVAMLGVEGSPSCSVNRVPRLVSDRRRMVKGSGLFTGALRQEMRRQGAMVPLIGVPETGGKKDLDSTWKRIGKLFLG